MQPETVASRAPGLPPCTAAIAVASRRIETASFVQVLLLSGEICLLRASRTLNNQTLQLSIPQLFGNACSCIIIPTWDVTAGFVDGRDEMPN